MFNKRARYSESPQASFPGRVKWFLAISICISLGLFTNNAFSERLIAQQSGIGYIQIKCASGVNVYLNKQFHGQTTQELQGLILKANAGRHTIKFSKQGSPDQLMNVQLNSDQVLKLEVSGFDFVQNTGFIRDATQVKQPNGRIVIQTLPVDSFIIIPGIDINEGNPAAVKNQDIWTRNDVPPGEYNATVMAFGRTVSLIIPVKPNGTTHLLVNVLENKIRDIGLEREAAAVAERQKREAAETAARAKNQAGRRKVLQQAIEQLKQDVVCYKTEINGHGRQNQRLKFKYKDYTNPSNVVEKQVKIKVKIELGDAINVRSDALVEQDNPNKNDLEVKAKGLKASLFGNTVEIKVYNKTAQRALKKFEDELRTLVH